MSRTVAIALAVAACGGSGTSFAPGFTPSCTVTLSGAITGTYDCKPAATAFTPSQNIGGFAFDVPPSDPAPEIQVGINWPGEPSAGVHYRNTDAGAQGNISVISGRGPSRQSWGACVGGGCTVLGGSYDLYFSTVSNPVDGTLTATLPSGGNLYGTVTMTVTF